MYQRIRSDGRPLATPWSPELEDQLRDLWAKGESASKCGIELGFSRNAIIGKVHRLGLPKRKRIGAVRSYLKKRKAKNPNSRKYHPSVRTYAPLKTSPWTEARVSELKRLHDQVLCCWEIGNKLGMTAGAIRQKLKHMGITPHPARGKPVGPTHFEDGMAEHPASMTPRRLVLVDMEAIDCRWPLEGEGIDTVFCGLQQEQGSSYCPHHARRAAPELWTPKAEAA